MLNLNKLTEMLRIEFPIIQAGMAGGITTPELVAAVSNNGALGTIGAGYMSARSLKETIQHVKKLTNRPFAVNLFATKLEAYTKNAREMQLLLDNYRKELGIQSGQAEIKVEDYLEEKIQYIIQEEVSIVSTAFGVLSTKIIERLKQHHITLLGMATNLEEAVMLEEAGYDIIIAQGYEAGGHRGTFDTKKYPLGSDIGLQVLIQSFLEHISIPIVAAGGIYSGSQVHSLLEQGASGVQIGTMFLVAKEAGTNNAYRQAIINADYTDTVITKVFSGRPARAILNPFIKEVERSGVKLHPFPIQNGLTQDIRSQASKRAIANLQSLWAGQGVGAIKTEQSAAEIIQLLLGQK